MAWKKSNRVDKNKTVKMNCGCDGTQTCNLDAEMKEAKKTEIGQAQQAIIVNGCPNGSRPSWQLAGTTEHYKVYDTT